MSDDASTKKFWGRLELMGHRQHLGIIYEVEMVGVKMIRVDVLQADGTMRPATYSASALYGVAEMTEEEVRKAAAPWRAALPPAETLDEAPRPAGRDEIYRYIDTRLANGDYDEIVLPERPKDWDERLTQMTDELPDLYDDDGKLEDPQQRRRALARLAAEAVAAVEAHDRAQAEGDEDDDIPFEQPTEEEPR